MKETCFFPLKTESACSGTVDTSAEAESLCNSADEEAVLSASEKYLSFAVCACLRFRMHVGNIRLIFDVWVDF